MKIAFDLDGVLYDFTSCFRAWMESVDPVGKQSGRYLPAPTCWDFYAVDWGMTLEEFKREMTLASSCGFLYRSQGIARSWQDLLANLVGAGHTLHAVTHRTEPLAQANTEGWIGDFDLPFTSITYAADKSTVAADILIEDRGENLDVWLENTDKPAIIVERAWNADWRRRLTDRPLGDWHDQEERRRVLVARDAEEVERIIDYLAEQLYMVHVIDGPEPIEPDAAAGDSMPEPTNPKIHETILQEAQRLVFGERQADYGHPIDDFTKTAGMWSAAFGWDVNPEDIPLAMIMVKISRERNRAKRDNAVDIAGYAGTLAMVRERQAVEG